MNDVFSKDFHFAFCNFHFSMKFSVPFQNAKLIQTPPFSQVKLKGDQKVTLQ